MCKWTNVQISDIPAKDQSRKSWYPDADDVAAIYDVAFGVADCKACKIGDEYSVDKKAQAIKNYIISNSSISNRVTAVARKETLFIVNMDKLQEEGQE